MCSGICSRIVRFAAFTLPVIFRNLCVHSYTTRKDPVKTRDLSCDVYNAARTISLNWRMISASARIVRSSLIAASFQSTYFSSWWTLICLQNTSASSLRRTLYGIDPAFVHTALVPGQNPAMLLGPQPGINPGINPGTCLRSHRRHSGNFLAIFRQFSGPTCSVNGACSVCTFSLSINIRSLPKVRVYVFSD